VLGVPSGTIEISSGGQRDSMRFRDLLTAFDEALEWVLDDPFLTDHVPCEVAATEPWPAVGYPLTSSLA
jgi:hypothetical protein